MKTVRRSLLSSGWMDTANLSLDEAWALARRWANKEHSGRLGVTICGSIGVDSLAAKKNYRRGRLGRNGGLAKFFNNVKAHRTTASASEAHKGRTKAWHMDNRADLLHPWAINSVVRRKPEPTHVANQDTRTRALPWSHSSWTLGF